MRLFAVFLLMIISYAANAQDLIVTNEGKVIKAKVVKVGSKVVEYNRYNNLTGPVYEINKSELFSIQYENGSVEKYGESSSSSGSNTSTGDASQIIGKSVEGIVKGTLEEGGSNRYVMALYQGEVYKLKILSNFSIISGTYLAHKNDPKKCMYVRFKITGKETGEFQFYEERECTK